MSKKLSLGEEALKRLNGEDQLSPEEASEQIADKSVWKKLEQVIATHKDFGREYFIQIILQQENFHRKHLPNVYHLQSVVTKANPGMRPDRSCWKYNNKEEKLTFLWALPDMQSCAFIFENRTEVSEEEKELLKYVVMFYNQCIESIRQKNFAPIDSG